MKRWVSVRFRMDGGPLGTGVTTDLFPGKPATAPWIGDGHGFRLLAKKRDWSLEVNIDEDPPQFILRVPKKEA